MTGLDLTPLFRSTVGYDRVSRLLESALSDNGNATTPYPPYNIEKLSDDAYRIVMAVAGFSEEDIVITVKESMLIVEGRITEKADEVRYLHRGIAGRAFERRFDLADHIKVDGATLENGLLVVDLRREIPEALKPRKIDIKTSSRPKALTKKAA
ncbi:MAG: Hsp20 family protein [Rhodospirillaceae bacterium]|nr:Hsp20 family protein [Rhodospirillaceae bacterium]MCY4237232.1 Hsp20 family protein [Rhodospirillaceae bacterium]